MNAPTRKKKIATSTRKPGRVAGRQIGERTVQLLKIPDSLYWSIILWSKTRSNGARKVNIGDIYDEALSWFLEREAKATYEAYRAVPLRNAQKRSLWLDSRLLEKAGEYAERDGVPRNRVVYTALVLYLKEFGPLATAEDIDHLRKIKTMGGERGRPIGGRRPAAQKSRRAAV